MSFAPGLVVAAALAAAACSPGGAARTPPGKPWGTFYGKASAMGDLALAASRFHLLDIDADPGRQLHAVPGRRAPLAGSDGDQLPERGRLRALPHLLERHRTRRAALVRCEHGCPARFPAAFIVVQNATGEVTRKGVTSGISFPSLLDGLSHEETYRPYDPRVEAQLLAWQQLGLKPRGRAFWVATEDYVGSCANASAARAIFDLSRANGFDPYASDSSAGQQSLCFWGF